MILFVFLEFVKPCVLLTLFPPCKQIVPVMAAEMVWDVLYKDEVMGSNPVPMFLNHSVTRFSSHVVHVGPVSVPFLVVHIFLYNYNIPL